MLNLKWLGLLGSADFGDDGSEEDDQLSGFAEGRGYGRIGDLAIFDQVFEPELGFVCFLEDHIQVGAELGIGPGTRGFTNMGRDRSSGPQHLPRNHPDFLSGTGERNKHPDDRRSERFAPLPQF